MRIIPSLSSLVVCFALLGTYLSSTAQLTEDPATVGKLGSLLYHIDRMYVDDVDNKKLVDAAIVSMLEELDPLDPRFTVFVD